MNSMWQKLIVILLSIGLQCGEAIAASPTPITFPIDLNLVGSYQSKVVKLPIPGSGIASAPIQTQGEANLSKEEASTEEAFGEKIFRNAQGNSALLPSRPESPSPESPSPSNASIPSPGGAYRFETVYESSINIDRLGAFIQNLMIENYNRKKLDSGYYMGQVFLDQSFFRPGIKILAIMPSEAFSNRNDTWDEFEIIATADPPPTGSTKQPAQLTMIARDYFFTSRGGLPLPGWSNGPSPNWPFTSPSDPDLADTRLEQIQLGIEQVEQEDAGLAVVAPASQ